MPSSSEAQKKLMQYAYGIKTAGKNSKEYKEAPDKIKKVADSMSFKQLKDFIQENKGETKPSTEKNTEPSTPENDVNVSYSGRDTESPSTEGEHVSDKVLTEFVKFGKMIDEAKTAHTQYGRGKLFNIPAMLEIIKTNTVLKNQYERLKQTGKEIFGYHYNEIILSFLFIKYIYKKNQALFDKYLELRKKNIETQKQEEEKEKQVKLGLTGVTATPPVEKVVTPNIEKELDETTTSASSGAYAQPAAFVRGKDIGKWKDSKTIKGAKIADPTYGDKFNFIMEEGLEEVTPKIKTFYDINPDTIYLFELSNPNVDLEVEGSEIINFIKNNKKAYGVPNYSEGDEGDVVYDYSVLDMQNVIKDFLKEKQKIKENTNYINNYNKQDNTMKEHHIMSREGKVMFILNNCDCYTEDQLNDMSDSDLTVAYNDIENKKFNNKEKSDKEILADMEAVNEFEIKDDGIEFEDKEVIEYSKDLLKTIDNAMSKHKDNKDLYDELRKLRFMVDNMGLNGGNVKYIYDKEKEELEPIFDEPKGIEIKSLDITPEPEKKSRKRLNKQQLDKIKNKVMSLNEENSNYKHPAMVKLDRIKKENEKNEKEDFKNANPGIKKGMDKKPEESSVYEYEYDKDSIKVEDINKYKTTSELQDFIDMQSRGAQDLDFDLKPSKEYLKKLKEYIGDDLYDKMIRKAKQRKLHRTFSHDAETEIHAPKSSDMINIKPTSKDLKVNESLNMTGYYTNKYQEKKFITIDYSNVKELNEKSDNLKPFISEGLGNKFSSILKEGNLRVVNETASHMEDFNYFIDTVDNSIYKIKKSTDDKKINEDVINKMKQILNYDSNDYYNNKKNNRARFES